MTTYSVFALYDKIADQYMKPFFELTYESALRALTEALDDKTTAMYKHAADLELTHLGYWDDDEGTLIPVSASFEHNAIFLSKLIPVSYPSTSKEYFSKPHTETHPCA